MHCIPFVFFFSAVDRRPLAHIACSVRAASFSLSTTPRGELVRPHHRDEEEERRRRAAGGEHPPLLATFS